MPLGHISGGGDRDHDPWPHTFAEAGFDVCAHGVGGAAGEVEQQLAAAPEKRSQKAWNGHHDVAVRDRREDLLVEALGPQKRALLLAGGAE